jgi:hypothetical protein
MLVDDSPGDVGEILVAAFRGVQEYLERIFPLAGMARHDQTDSHTDDVIGLLRLL